MFFFNMHCVFETMIYLKNCQEVDKFPQWSTCNSTVLYTERFIMERGKR